MVCKNCGNELKDGAGFCTSCGTAVTAENEPQAQAQVEAQAPIARSIGFGEAIKLLFQNYANFKGRATRSEFWWGFLFIWLLNFAATYIPVLGGIVSLALLIPNLSLCIRRLHDIGKSWVWFLMGLIPLVGWIILIVYYCKASDGDNQWGAAL